MMSGDDGRVAGDDEEGADRVGLAPAGSGGGSPASSDSGRRKKAKTNGDAADAGGGVERHARAELAEDAAEERAGDEADAEGDADQAEILRPLLRRA